MAIPPTERVDLEQLAKQAAELAGLTAEQVPGLLELFKMVDREAFALGYARGCANEKAAAQESIDTLGARVLELQREIGEAHMQVDRLRRELAEERDVGDTTVGSGR